MNPTEVYEDLCEMYVDDLYCFLAMFDMNSDVKFSESEFISPDELTRFSISRVA